MKVRIGIDVGGTFTDVAVVHNETHELVGQLKFPTTHTAHEGVALGIIQALERAMDRFGIDPENVSFIAHSTTQATNALLEGDAAAVGVIGIGGGVETWLARRATRVPPITLTPAKRLVIPHRFVRARNGSDLSALKQAVCELSELGVRVIVVSEAFGVDRPERELETADLARRLGLLATTGHEVSSLYGLRVRTRTAVINAAILPKMIETAEMTERCVQSSGIRAPLMIMRSDGGVMSVAEVRRRPILTMLSGPAAGIAGALMHERVSDGIFIEVGGTSADVSVIRDGSPATRPARLSGHRMYLNTLDVRTLGIAGGSLVRVARQGDRPAGVLGVGPRSAHIAGFGYACYAKPEEFSSGVLRLVTPASGDSNDHVVIQTSGGKNYALTTTCAANLLGHVQKQHFAYGNAQSARLAFQLLAASIGDSSITAEGLAEDVLHIASRVLIPIIEDLIVEYHLDRKQVVLVGGGGGAAALVPYTAGSMGLAHRIARNAEVISPLGVAMAMVRDTVERNIIDPTPEDILKIRREATEAVVVAGAVPDSVEVQVEVDKRRNLVRATSIGTTEMRRRAAEVRSQSLEECRIVAARSMHIDLKTVELAATTGNFMIFTAEQMEARKYPGQSPRAPNLAHKFGEVLRRAWYRSHPFSLPGSQRLFGILHRHRQLLRVVDHMGVVRLQRGSARVVTSDVAHLKEELTRAVDLLTDYGDAGRTMPDIFILYRGRIANFSGLADLDQVAALAEAELRSLEPETSLVVISCPKAL